jgi:hypothetical protein
MSKRNVLLALAALLIAAGSAYAQSIKFQVPFQFVAGTHNLPAGGYTIELNREEHTMTLRSEGRSGSINSVVMLANNVPQNSNPDKSYALFNRYGSQYFLTQVWREGAGQSLPPGKMEREFASQRTTPALVRAEALLSPQ